MRAFNDLVPEANRCGYPDGLLEGDVEVKVAEPFAERDGGIREGVNDVGVFAFHTLREVVDELAHGNGPVAPVRLVKDAV